MACPTLPPWPRATNAVGRSAHHGAGFAASGAGRCLVFCATRDLTTEQAISILLGVSFAAILSGATAYGSGISVGLGAERLALATKAAVPPRQAGRVTASCHTGYRA